MSSHRTSRYDYRIIVIAISLVFGGAGAWLTTLRTGRQSDPALPIPSGIGATETDGAVILTWEHDSDAAFYRIG